MREKTITSITVYFGGLPDPRVERTKRHSLLDILTIAILGVICGALGWEDFETFGNSKEKWLKTFLELENGIPCADTFRRVFAAIDSSKFEACFMNWVRSLSERLGGKVVAIDGKSLRGTYGRASLSSPLHLVHAYACEQELLLGQVATEEKSNEITAIPELIDLLDLRGSIVTIDAMGCQKAIAKKIVKSGADYILAVKGNQEKLEEEVIQYFDQAKRELSYTEASESGHGRRETRRIWSGEVLEGMSLKKWEGLSSFILVESEREVKGKTSIEKRYYISSLKGIEATEFGKMIRSHWAIENNLHWRLDVSLREDACQIHEGNAARNLSLLRKLALTMLKRTTQSKRGIAAKSRTAGWDHDFLLTVIAQGGKN